MKNKADNIAKHRLGVARKALKKILNYKMDSYEDYIDAKSSLQYIAESALKAMEEIK